MDYPDGSSVHARYDAAGNIVRVVNQNGTEASDHYDAANRLIGPRSRTPGTDRPEVERFEYDGVGRLIAASSAKCSIRKVVTDSSGVGTEYSYVWAGSLLIEEYENGVLVRTYVYGVGFGPLRLAVTKNGRAEYFYVHDGRGLVRGLVLSTDPNAFAEKYTHELTGAAYMKEINGVSVGTACARRDPVRFVEFHPLGQRRLGGVGLAQR